MRGSGVIPAVGAIVAVLGSGGTLVACSAPSPAASSHRTHTPAAAVATSGFIDLCAIFTAKDAARASGLKLTNAQDEYVGTPGLYECTYTNGYVSDADADKNAPDVSIYTTKNPTTLAQLKASLDEAATDVAPTVSASGVGEEAYVSSTGIAARFGQRIIRIDAITADRSGDHTTTIALAKAVMPAVEKAAPQS